MLIDKKLKEVILSLHKIDALKFGDFKMKVGINSPVYFDLRVIVSYPSLMKDLSSLLWEFAQTNGKYNCKDHLHVCGVPYTALPIATLVSASNNIPMLIRRKESKSYGTKKMIEGRFSEGDSCVIIEDVVTSGSSILDTYSDLKREGLNVHEAIVVVDREQGGCQNLEKYGIKMRSLVTLSQIMDILLEGNRIDTDTAIKVKSYITSTQIPLNNYLFKGSTSFTKENNCRLTMPYRKRSEETKNLVAKNLFHIMEEKKTNLCLSVDVLKSEELLALVEACGPYICLLKTHIDILNDFSENVIDELKRKASLHNFLILEDRKFSDIGHITGLQYSEGVHKIRNWADLVTVHAVSGIGNLLSLTDKTSGLQRGCFLIVEMSCKGALTTNEYKTVAVSFYEDNKEFITGFVCQTSDCVKHPGLIQLTPGVSTPSQKDDGQGQQYDTPENAVLVRGADIVVVGRAITNSSDPKQAALSMKNLLWAAYEKRILA